MRRAFLSIQLFILFLHEMLIATLRVLVRIFRSNKTLHPVIIRLPLRTRKPMGLWLFSLIISLTPGSLIVEINEQERHLYVHLLHAPAPEKWVAHMRKKFEARICRLLGEKGAAA